MKNGTWCYVIGLFLLLTACSEPVQPTTPTAIPHRETRIPADAVKMNPTNDPHPPMLHHKGWEKPIPMPGSINTAGAEDAPFILPDGKTFLFFFTPDVSIPAEKQLLDGVTGIYQSTLQDGAWSDPTRVILNDQLSLDGCPFVLDNRLWFCTAREGYTGLHWFIAYFRDGMWTDWHKADFTPSHQVGELHISADLQELYFHANRPGTLGANDIWLSMKTEDGWGEPIHLETVNSPDDDSRPFLSENGQALWFTRTYRGSPAVFRALKENGSWGEPELIISQFAGEPTLDREGNLYFVHHYFLDGEMIEADIYLAKKK